MIGDHWDGCAAVLMDTDRQPRVGASVSSG